MSHLHGSPGLECTDPHCQHESDLYRHTKNCTPETCLILMAAELEEERKRNRELRAVEEEANALIGLLRWVATTLRYVDI